MYLCITHGLCHSSDSETIQVSEGIGTQGLDVRPPAFISVSGLMYAPRAPWGYGTSQMDCLPVSRPILMPLLTPNPLATVLNCKALERSS